MEEITDADYKDEKRVWKDFKIRNLGNYYDLNVQSDTLLVPGIQNKCIETYELGSANFFAPTGLAW